LQLYQNDYTLAWIDLYWGLRWFTPTAVVITPTAVVIFFTAVVISPTPVVISPAPVVIYTTAIGTKEIILYLEFVLNIRRKYVIEPI